MVAVPILCSAQLQNLLLLLERSAHVHDHNNNHDGSATTKMPWTVNWNPPTKWPFDDKALCSRDENKNRRLTTDHFSLANVEVWNTWSLTAVSRVCHVVTWTFSLLCFNSEVEIRRVASWKLADVGSIGVSSHIPAWNTLAAGFMSREKSAELGSEDEHTDLSEDFTLHNATF